MNTSVHLAKMVPTAGLEPAQVAPLAPQTSASTNFATSAIHQSSDQAIHPASNESIIDHGRFAGAAGGGAGVPDAGTEGAVAGGGGLAGTALVVSACAARSSSVDGTALARVPT